jgi:hypothetical protein
MAKYGVIYHHVIGRQPGHWSDRCRQARGSLEIDDIRESQNFVPEIPSMSPAASAVRALRIAHFDPPNWIGKPGRPPHRLPWRVIRMATRRSCAFLLMFSPFARPMVAV